MSEDRSPAIAFSWLTTNYAVGTLQAIPVGRRVDLRHVALSNNSINYAEDLLIELKSGGASGDVVLAWRPSSIPYATFYQGAVNDGDVFNIPGRGIRFASGIAVTVTGSAPGTLYTITLMYTQ